MKEILGKIELLHPEGFIMNFEIIYDNKTIIRDVKNKDNVVATGSNLSDALVNFGTYTSKFIQG